MLQRFVLLVTIALLSAPAAAQDVTDTWSEVKISDLLATVTILDDSGRLWSGEVLQLNTDGLELMQDNGEVQHFTVMQVRRLETSGRDSIKNGGLIGAGLGAALGIAVAASYADSGGCSVACLVGTPVAFGAVWGAMGLAVDFIIPGERRLTLYQASGPSSKHRYRFGSYAPGSTMTFNAAISW